MKVIRLKKMKRWASEVLGKEANIHLTTELNSLVAVGTHNDKFVDIMVNANICKSEEDVLVAVAHELAHIKLGVNKHTEEFEEEVKKLLRDGSKTFNISYTKLITTKKKLDKIAGR